MVQLFGFELGNSASGQDDSGVSASVALTIEHNNYEGISITPSLGFAFNAGGIASVGMNLSSSATEGVSVSPSIGISKKMGQELKKGVNAYDANLGAGLTYNSRQGLTSFSVNTSMNANGLKEDSKTKISHSIGSAGGRVSFIDNTFTPSKRNAFRNAAFTFDASFGTDFWGIDAELGITAFGTQQKLKTKSINEKAYGYEFTKNASANDILDFNRENDNIVSKNTLILPTVNYTYDLYSIQGQGTGGQFRPYKSQVGHVFDQYVEDTGASGQLGVEIEGATGFHIGVDLKYTDIKNHTGVWNTPAKNQFENSENNDLDYEETYFKSTGDLSVDDNLELFNKESGNDHLGGESPIALDIVPNNKRQYGKYATNVFRKKLSNLDNTVPDDGIESNFEYESITINDKLKRSSREKRNQAILKVNKAEAINDPFIHANNELKNHHTNGVKILNPDGATYVYGEAAVNMQKEEVSFNSGDYAPDYLTGTVIVNGNDTSNNREGLDYYFNKITTPQYAHSYLLTSVLSTDYEDLTGDGPTDDDLGAYTKFHYNNFVNDSNETNTNNPNDKIESVAQNYNWRVPFNDNTASYSPGLNTLIGDQKGSYTQGQKELKYATMIETKTHVAIFDFIERLDGKSNDGDIQLAINTIKLYSKPEAIAANLLDDDATNNGNIAPIKTAHFTYNYDLMPGNPVNYSSATDNGKLTLESVYFTYRDSKMGKYTPYTFNYENSNPSYQMKSYDIWANYKPLFENNSTTLTNCTVRNDLTASEFPFVDQTNRAQQDEYAAAWTLSSINLPSGGKIELQYESDDYQYVQDRKAMQMFKLAGVSSDLPDGLDHLIGDETQGELYQGSRESKYIIIELPSESTEQNNINNLQGGDFKDRYIGEHFNKPIYFNVLTNMTKIGDCSYDYVSGYFEIDKDPNVDFKIFLDNDGDGDKVYAGIPMKLVRMEGDGRQVNPISHAGWWFGRKNLNRFVSGVGDNTPDDASLEEIVENLKSNFGNALIAFKSPNAPLRDTQKIAKKFIPKKSWIRLQHPNNAKIGGGLRVKQVKMFDNWDIMNNQDGNDRYANFYGQDYNYQLDNNEGSSGVATWEPNASIENPFVEPFYNTPQKLIAPKEVNYVEKPFGKSFFPAPAVTYSQVTVSNLQRVNDDGIVLKKHATGKVVNQFYTYNDFPTQADFTELDDPNNYKDNLGNLGNSLLSSLIGISRARTELALSQGFTVITNDMNGKSKSQKVYDENNNLVSGVDYKYHVNELTGNLNNKLPVIKEDGSIVESLIGTQYDVITDFRESYNRTVTRGVNVNLAAFIIGVYPIILPVGLYSQQDVESTLHTTTTTKVIHKSGILKEKIAYDLGATVSTKNLAWDAVSGQVLLTKTINEYDDNYYNFSYPAHWAYKGMGQAVENLGIEATLVSVPASSNSNDGDVEGENSTWYALARSLSGNGGLLKDFFNQGDQVILLTLNSNGSIPSGGDNRFFSDNRYWINQISGNQMVLIDSYGNYLNPCGDDSSLSTVRVKIVKSFYKNLQSASMASVTSMLNPLDTDNNGIIDDNFDGSALNYDGDGINPKIINASAVEYKDAWHPNYYNNIRYPNVNSPRVVSYPNFHNINPFKYNILGEWRAVKSYAYLTGRTNEASPRNDGYFTSFNPFYIYNRNFTPAKWTIDYPELVDGTTIITHGADNWTFASEVTKYSPYGAELENKDALGRYSSAIYGYNNTLPIAVGSNTEFRQLGYDGFEVSESNHFKYNVSAPISNATISTQEAHTGRKSIKVPSGEVIRLNRPLFNDCLQTDVTQELDCTPTCGNSCDYPNCDCADDEPFCESLNPGTTSNLVSVDGDLAVFVIDFSYGSNGPGSFSSGACVGSSLIIDTYGEFSSATTYTNSISDTIGWLVPLQGDEIVSLTIRLIDATGDTSECSYYAINGVIVNQINETPGLLNRLCIDHD